MRVTLPFALLFVLSLAFASSSTTIARADERTPELALGAYRRAAQEELEKLVAALPPREREKVTGVYVAHDDDASDPIALAACDDDGDPVVVLSEAMLRLMANVARAQTFDEANGSRRIEEYAEHLARVQVPGRRLLPPPPGFYTAQIAAPTFDERFREALAFAIARELAHHRAGDRTCPRPTATHEHGDDVWTEEERRRAMESAASLYPGRGAERDRDAADVLISAGRRERGGLGLLRFFAHVELERTVTLARFEPTYLRMHPSSTTRIATLRASFALRATNATTP